jgi:hypothetical protein
MRKRSSSDVRLRTALQLSGFCLGGMIVASRFLEPTSDPSRAMVLFFFAVSLALGSVFGYWTLLAALAERRPALSHPVGRWVWAWALVLWVAVGWAGWSVHTDRSIGAVMIVGAAELIVVSGIAGLTFALFGRRNPADRCGPS